MSIINIFLSILLISPLFAEEVVLLNNKAIQVIQKSEGIYLYVYEETIEPLNPYKDYKEKYRITSQNIITRLSKLISENKEYTPEFKAKCLPVWDYGLEFKKKEETYLFLFSFRCKTIHYVNENLYKDFSPQSVEFYQIFKYEIDEKSSTKINEFL